MLMIQITIPEMETNQYDEISNIDRHSGGVYMIFTKEHKLMYVGKSNYLKGRLHTHFAGGDPHTSKYRQYLNYFKFFIENDPFSQDIYETYLINEFKPFININKVFTYSIHKNRVEMKVPYVDKWSGEAKNYYACKAVTIHNTQCTRKPTNGDFCGLHSKITIK